MTPSELRIFHRLQIAAHRLQKAADRELIAAAGVTTAQAAVLALIGRPGGAHQRQIARRLGVRDSAITAMVKRLMSLGFVDRTRAPDDARSWNLTLTEHGRAALDAMQPAFRGVNDRIAGALDSAELQSLADHLTRLSTAFDRD